MESDFADQLDYFGRRKELCPVQAVESEVAVQLDYFGRRKELFPLKKQAQKPDLPQRDRILAAATEVFLECGFGQTSTAEIASRAKVSKRELYAHFADKHALLVAVVTAHQALLEGELKTARTPGEDIATILEKIAGAVQNFLLSERFGKMMRLVVAASFYDVNLAEQFYENGPNRGRKAVAQLLKAQMKVGTLRKADPEAAADLFFDLVVGSHLTMAAVLGQLESRSRSRRDIHQSLASFLTLYRPDNGS